MVETAFSDVRGLRLTGGSPTKSTVVHEEFLKRASKDELAAYYNWVRLAPVAFFGLTD